MRVQMAELPTDANGVRVKPIYLTLAHPPTANTYYRRSGHIMHISKRGKQFALSVTADVLNQLGKPPKLTGRLSVLLRVNAPDKRKRDIDNVVKPSLDALTKAGVWQDDSQLDDIQILRGEIRKPGSLFVVIREIT